MTDDGVYGRKIRDNTKISAPIDTKLLSCVIRLQPEPKHCSKGSSTDSLAEAEDSFESPTSTRRRIENTDRFFFDISASLMEPSHRRILFRRRIPGDTNLGWPGVPENHSVPREFSPRHFIMTIQMVHRDRVLVPF